jgi:uncharacterized protein (DUF952 family)
MSNIVYKIVSKVNWTNFIKSGAKECKGFDNDLKDGFIHLSTHEQLYSTFIKKYNLSNKDKFNVLAVDLNESEIVKWERTKNGNTYPHLYSPLILNKNIVWVYGLENYQFNANGI